MRGRGGSGCVAPERHRPAAGGAELELLLASIRRRRSAARERLGERGAEAVPADARVHTPPGAPAPAAASGGAVVLEARDVGGSVRILRVARPPGFTFRAGQAVKVGLPGVPLRRSYSLASAPAEPELELCVEKMPGGRFSSLLHGLAPGSRLVLGAKPKGSLSLQAGKRRHLMVATVTGVAPLRSMLREALARQNADVYWVLHGASFADELPYADELAELARREPRVRYLPTVSRPGEPRNQGWAGRVGRVEAHVEEAVRALGSPADVAVYACGHPQMVANVRDALVPQGYAVSGEDFG